MDAERHAELQQITEDIPQARLEQDEHSRFGRHAVYNCESYRRLEQKLES